MSSKEAKRMAHEISVGILKNFTDDFVIEEHLNILGLVNHSDQDIEDIANYMTIIRDALAKKAAPNPTRQER